ncbi:hypothetical protein D3C71_1851130 [compost metagenome]
MSSRAIDSADVTFHIEWNSHITSILSPTARRIFSNTSRPWRMALALTYCPSDSVAAPSNGQIFIALKPSSIRLCASSPGLSMNAIWSS